MKIGFLAERFIYYFLTSGIFISISLVILEVISKKFNLVDMFAFASASFFLINLMQYNVVANENIVAVPGFLKQTIFGSLVYLFFAVIIFILYKFNNSREEIIIYMLITIIIVYILYAIAYKNGLLKF